MTVVQEAGYQTNDELLKKRVAEVVMNLPSGNIFIDTSIVDALSALVHWRANEQRMITM
jgi:hypothetical protein